MRQFSDPENPFLVLSFLQSYNGILLLIMAYYKLYLETKRYAGFVGKLPYLYMKHELSLSYYYMRSNVDAAFLPFPIFTTASLLYRGAEFDEIVTSRARAHIQNKPKDLICQNSMFWHARDRYK